MSLQLLNSDEQVDTDRCCRFEASEVSSVFVDLVLESAIMESIKLKMSELVKAKSEAMDHALEFEEAKEEFEEECLNYN